MELLEIYYTRVIGEEVESTQSYYFTGTRENWVSEAIRYVTTREIYPYFSEGIEQNIFSNSDLDGMLSNQQKNLLLSDAFAEFWDTIPGDNLRGVTLAMNQLQSNAASITLHFHPLVRLD